MAKRKDVDEFRYGEGRGQVIHTNSMFRVRGGGSEFKGERLPNDHVRGVFWLHAIIVKGKRVFFDASKVERGQLSSRFIFLVCGKSYRSQLTENLVHRPYRVFRLTDRIADKYLAGVE